jgi:hypothetical protein
VLTAQVPLQAETPAHCRKEAWAASSCFKEEHKGELVTLTLV